jgi:multimeric flavodoxin WrbA
MFLFEDYEKIFGKIMNVDGVVFGVSNYINSVSAPIKTLFDRFSYVTHCQILTGKFGCSVCTAVGSGDDEVLKYMNSILVNLGVIVVGSIGVVIRRDLSGLENYIVPAQDIGKKLIKSIRGEIKYADQDEIHTQQT